jgi:hypothetical protein
MYDTLATADGFIVNILSEGKKRLHGDSRGPTRTALTESATRVGQVESLFSTMSWDTSSVAGSLLMLAGIIASTLAKLNSLHRMKAARSSIIVAATPSWSGKNL